MGNAWGSARVAERLIGVPRYVPSSCLYLGKFGTNVEEPLQFESLCDSYRSCVTYPGVVPRICPCFFLSFHIIERHSHYHIRVGMADCEWYSQTACHLCALLLTVRHLTSDPSA